MSMATIRHDNRALRLAIVVVLSLISISMWLPDFARAFGHPVGLGSMAAVAPQLARLRGPVKPFLAGTPPAERMRIEHNAGCWQPSPGIPCDFAVLNNGHVVHLHIPTVAEPRISGTIAAIRCAVALVWLIAAACLVMLRPSHATWAFFVFSLYGQTPNNVFTEVGPPWWQVTTSTFSAGWSTVSCVALIFALYLLQPERLPGWRRIALIAAYALVIADAAFNVAGTLAVAAGNETALVLVGANSAIQYIAGDVVFFVPPLLLLATYLDSDRTSRERIRWVLAGFTVGAIAMAAKDLADNFSYFYYSLCMVVYVLAITGSTMYAVLRHRIIDINVFLSRTVVYTLLSGVVVGLFALVDLFFTKTLSESNTGLIADVILALVLGFFLNTMHHRLDRFVDGFVFRKRNIAEKHVALVAESARYATSIEALNGMMIEEPVQAFGLTFGALARCVDDDGLQVVCATVPQLQNQMLGPASRLASYLRAQGRSASTIGSRMRSPPPVLKP